MVSPIKIKINNKTQIKKGRGRDRGRRGIKEGYKSIRAIRRERGRDRGGRTHKLLIIDNNSNICFAIGKTTNKQYYKIRIFLKIYFVKRGE